MITWTNSKIKTRCIMLVYQYLWLKQSKCIDSILKSYTQSLTVYSFSIVRSQWGSLLCSWQNIFGFRSKSFRGSPFRILFDDPNVHPRWPPSVDIVLTWDPVGKMFENLLHLNCLANWDQTGGIWSFCGPLSELWPMTPTCIQDSHHSFNIGPYGKHF